MGHLFRFFAIPNEVHAVVERAMDQRGFAIWSFTDDRYVGRFARVPSLLAVRTTRVWIGNVPADRIIETAEEAATVDLLASIEPPRSVESTKEILLGELWTTFSAPPPGSPYRVLKYEIGKILTWKTVAFSDLGSGGRTVPGPRWSSGARERFAAGWRLGQDGVRYVHYRPG